MKELNSHISHHNYEGTEPSHVEIVVDPGILLPRKYLSWQKIFGKVTALNHKIDSFVRLYESIEYFLRI